MIYPGILLIVLLSIAALIDLFKHQIPNWLTGVGIVVALIWALLDPIAATSLTSAMAGTLAGLVFLFPVFLIGKVGAGDVKLLGMAGAFLGPVALFWGTMFSLIAGGVLAMVWMLMLKLAPLKVRRMVPNATSTALFLAAAREQNDISTADSDLSSDPRRFPYACAIAVGCSLAYLGFN